MVEGLNSYSLALLMRELGSSRDGVGEMVDGALDDLFTGVGESRRWWTQTWVFLGFCGRVWVLIYMVEDRFFIHARKPNVGEVLFI